MFPDGGRLWEAYRHRGGRTGRWGALVAIGASIQAAADLDELEPYREPMPMRSKWIQIAGQPSGVYQTVAIDPEDEEFETEQRPDIRV